MNINSMRKTTVTMILGIMIGMIISNISNQFAVPVNIEKEDSQNILPPVATKINKLPEFNQVIAPGLQIIEVPPPLDLNGRYPYQCYFNGQPVKLPNDVVKNLLVDNDHLIEKDDSVNIHNFTGNLKMIDAPVGATLPSSFPQGGRTR